jgi:hypothetical protein
MKYDGRLADFCRFRGSRKVGPGIETHFGLFVLF